MTKSTKNIFDNKELISRGLDDCIIYDTKKKGKTLVIFGSVHGDEGVGVEAISEFYSKLIKAKISLDKGKIIFIFGNRQAFEKGVRFVDENMNRSFKTKKSKNTEGERAKEIESFLKKENKKQKIDFVLDLHSVSIGDLQMAIVNSKNIIKKIKKITETNIIVNDYLNQVSGSTMCMAERLGAEAMGLECGNHISKKSLNVAMRHINKVLLYLGMTKQVFTKELKLKSKSVYYQIEEKIKPREGFAFCDKNVATDTFVKKGGVYAEAEKYKYISKKDYYILMPAKNPNPKDEDAGFLVTRKEI